MDEHVRVGLSSSDACTCSEPLFLILRLGSRQWTADGAHEGLLSSCAPRTDDANDWSQRCPGSGRRVADRLFERTPESLPWKIHTFPLSVRIRYRPPAEALKNSGRLHQGHIARNRFSGRYRLGPPLNSTEGRGPCGSIVAKRNGYTPMSCSEFNLYNYPSILRGTTLSLIQ